MKTNIDKLYFENEEVRTSDKSYKAYFECLIDTFENIDSFCDVGCATGHLASFIKENGCKKVRGYEYFEYHKNSNYCKPNIKEDIVIFDIRNPLSENIEKFELVNCSEVGEHIDPLYADVLMNNLKKLSGKYILMTWSPSGGERNRWKNDPRHQHLNPLTRKEYLKLMEKHGLKRNQDLTEKFIKSSKTKKDFASWWTVCCDVWEI